VTLGALCDLLRAKGVRRYHGILDGAPCELEFLPPEAPPLKDSKPTVDAETCHCGHGLHAHNAGLCLLGCEPDKCAGPEMKP
jgi:hypothetical protein